MRATFLAIASVILAFLYFLPAITTDVPREFEFYRNIALMVILGWLAVEAWAMARWAKEKEQAPHVSAGKPPAAVAEHESLKMQLAKAADDKAALEARYSDLRRAYDDVQAKLERVEQDLRQKLSKSADAEVVSLLSLLQLKGRFVDFVMDDITKYPDAQVGAAARVVHQGCSQVVREYFDIKPVHEEGPEGAALTLNNDYDTRRYRLLGRVTGEPPYKGRLLHRGWVTASVRLPEAIDATEAEATPAGRGIIAPAEVELH